MFSKCRKGSGRLENKALFSVIGFSERIARSTLYDIDRETLPVKRALA
jgi:hypothetical protein